ncbi:MAG: hypothetical protein M3198_07990 [Actinomycetota bacterium]|nr:hypothetical protein [Actinomycetota bacterium]
MTLTEKLEQSVTKRPNSYLPGRTLLALVKRKPSEDTQPPVVNHLMHWGTGMALGALRGVWSASGLRGPGASAVHTVVRLATDQTFENATGVGAPPSTWPPNERIVDVAHKAVYAVTTGAFGDLMVPTATPSPGRTSH